MDKITIASIIASVVLILIGLINLVSLYNKFDSESKININDGYINTHPESPGYVIDLYDEPWHIEPMKIKNALLDAEIFK